MEMSEGRLASSRLKPAKNTSSATAMLVSEGCGSASSACAASSTPIDARKASFCRPRRSDRIIGGTISSTEPAITGIERLDPVVQLLLDEAAHRQHARTDALEIGVEAAQDVVREI